MNEPTGYILYRGPSLLNGEPIALVAIPKSHNEKTGDVVQTYILLDTDERPTQALKSGADAAVCGDCTHRPLNAGSCYVVVRQGATRVWQQLRAGWYPDAHPYLDELGYIVGGRMVRMGTYGDPAAVPIEVWKRVLAQAKGWIGYTHQWALELAQPLRYYCMASVDNPVEKGAANARGWRTFRVRLPGESLLGREAVCPASDEGEHKLTCAQCGVCDGALSGRRGNVAIIVHGAKGPWQPVQRYTRWRAGEGSAA